MTEIIHSDYQVSSEGAVRHWEYPFSRLSDITPTPSNPAMILGALIGSELTGTILTIYPAESIAVIDVTCSMVYWHPVRNVTDYDNFIEFAWGAINIADPIYYDDSATMPAGVYLSLSPINNIGIANPIFGYAAARDDADMALFPKGVAGIAETIDIAVMQRGAAGT